MRLKQVTLLLIVATLPACGYLFMHDTNHPPPCDCPVAQVVPVPVQFTPVPNEATVNAAPQGAGVDVTASCDSNTACQNLTLGVNAGTYDITVDANGYRNVTVSITFSRVNSPNLTPDIIPITLDPN